MDDVIVYKGKEYTREEVEEVIEMAKQMWDHIKSIAEEVMEYAKEIITNFINHIRKNPPVGLKRLIKKEQLLTYEKESIGKSNNWRKIHGLHLRRRL